MGRDMRYAALIPALALLPVLGFLAGLAFFFRAHAWDYSDGYKTGYAEGQTYVREYENRMAVQGLCVYADLACHHPLQEPAKPTTQTKKK